MNEEILFHTDDWRGVLVEKAIQQDALLKVMAARLASIEGHLTDVSAESIYLEMQNDVKDQIKKSLTNKGAPEL